MLSKKFLKNLKKINIKNVSIVVGMLSAFSSSVALASSNDKLGIDNINYQTNSFYYNHNPRNEALVSKFFAHLPFEYSVKTKYGSGKDILAIFIDANCPYCLEYEKKLKDNQEYINATAYLFLVDLLDDPYKINNFLWCSKDRAKNIHSWYKYKSQNKHLSQKDLFESWKKTYNLTAENCKAPLDFNKALMSSFFKLEGNKIATPTTVFTNGLTSWSVETPYSLKAGFDYVKAHPFEVQGYEKINSTEVVSQLKFFKDTYLKEFKKEENSKEK